MPDRPGPSGELPAFCCAILRDSRGRYVFERRPLSEPYAAGQLTCFGGSREDGETPQACLRREVKEELGFEVEEIALVVVLRTPEGTAWFYAAAGPEEGTAWAVEEGYEAVWVGSEEMAAAPVSRWHRVAIAAMLAGEREASVDR